ncbi:MAG TPA: potassium channel protein [Acidimicrobiales bacterium]|nr:potassium channel protein [Acidimicrobiales bacterium]
MSEGRGWADRVRRRPSGMPPPDPRWTSLLRAVALLVGVLAVGTVGYLLLGLSPLDALYQSVTTVTTVGFREVGEPTAPFRWFTIFLVIAGVGIALYALGVLLEALVEGRISEGFERRRMERELAGLSGHVVVCGWGRVGQALAAALRDTEGNTVVAVERDPERAAAAGLHVAGDATDEAVLRRAGVERCRALVVALPEDAANVYVTLSARRLRPGLFIVARAHADSAEPLLEQAGADRVVNPQAIGGERMAALIAQPHVADFLDVAMRDAGLRFRLSELTVGASSPVAGRSLRDAHLRDATGALVLAVRSPDGRFRTNPDPGDVMEAGEVLITIGTEAQLAALRRLVAG